MWRNHSNENQKTNKFFYRMKKINFVSVIVILMLSAFGKSGWAAEKDQELRTKLLIRKQKLIDYKRN